MFVDPTEVTTADYANFWARLACGEYDRRQYKRISKDGTEIWIEASYNPVFSGGKPYKVVKFATDITEQKLKAAEDSGKLDAISRAQAVIEFTPNGDIVAANENFLRTMGYQLSEVQGKHHSIFCEPSYTNRKRIASSGTSWPVVSSSRIVHAAWKRWQESVHPGIL